MLIWTVYIIKSQKWDKYYTGVTDNLEKRLYEHNNGLSLYTKGGGKWALKHFEEFDSIRDAYKREKFIKNKKSRKIIGKIIGSPNIELKKLCRSSSVVERSPEKAGVDSSILSSGIKI